MTNRYLRHALFSIPLMLALTGCLSISSTKSPEPVYADPCQGKEQVCRDICGAAGVQAFSCTAKPGEGMDYKCDCRKQGPTI